MVDMTSQANQFAGEAQRRISSGTEFGLNIFRPILHWQVLMLRMWADSVERFATNYEKEAHEVASTVK